MRTNAAVDLRLNADQYVAGMIGGQDFIGIHAHTRSDRNTHVRRSHSRSGASEGTGGQVSNLGALGIEGVTLLPRQWLGVPIIITHGRVLANILSYTSTTLLLTS